MQVPPFTPSGLLDETDTKYFIDSFSSSSFSSSSSSSTESSDESEEEALQTRAKDMLLRDKECGEEILEVRKKGAFRGYTYIRPHNMGCRKSLFAY